MNGSIFRRIVWKEYREQRTFWLAMAGMVAGLELLVLGLSRAYGPPPTDLLFGIALALAALYALGSGATLFATERETGTYEFQRAIPVTATRLFAGKVTLAALGTAAMFAFVWLMTFVIAGMRWPLAGDHLALWGVWGIAGVELLVWGILFSLLTSRPLVAAILGVSAASLCVHLAAWTLVAKDLTSSQVLDLGLYLRAIPYRIVVVALVGAVDVWLGRRWLGKVGPAPSEASPARPRKKEPKPQEQVLGPTRPSSGRVLGRLVWQQWRQSRHTMAALAVPGIVMLLAWVWLRSNPGVLWQFCPRVVGQSCNVIVISTGMAAIMGGLLGSCVFLADQQGGRSRYLAERGARPTLVWLSRQLVWIGPLLLVAAAAMAMALLGDSVPRIESLLRREGYYLERAAEGGWAVVPFYDLATLVVCAFLAYAAGQLTSMFLRSGILAVVFGLLLGLLLCGWAWAMRLLDINWFWSVLPIPPVLLWTTWLRTSDWIVERNNLRAWLGVALSLGLPAALIVAAVPAARVRGVPLVEPGFSPDEYVASTTPEGRATGEMYRRALDLLVRFEPPPQPGDGGSIEGPQRTGPVVPLSQVQAACLKASSQALALALEATERAECDYYDPARLSTYARPGPGPSELGWLIVTSARQYQTEGNLDEAQRRYLAALRLSRHLRPYAHSGTADGVERLVYEYLPSWAIHPGQTPQRIAEMLRQIDEILARLPSRTDGIKTDYVLWSRDLAGDPEWMQTVFPHKDVATKIFLLEWLPGERARAQRVLDLLVAGELQRCRRTEEAAASGLPIPVLSLDSLRRSQAYVFERYKTWVLPDGLGVWNHGLFLSQIEEARRVVRLVLAIEAWRLEHGELPKTLDALMGRYLDRLPTDPTTARPFRYFPQGLPVALAASTYLYGEGLSVPPGTPFLARSWFDLSVGKAPAGDSRYGHRYANRWEAKEDVWYAGQVFPLPKPGKPAAGGSPAKH